MARAVLILFALGIAFYLVLLLMLVKDAEKDGAVKSDAILVLGSRAYVNGRINICLKARVAQGVRLLERGYGKFLILSGGDDVEDGVNEAETMRLLALQMGVQQNQILLERRATSTFENLTLSRPILEQNKLSSLIIVTVRMLAYLSICARVMWALNTCLLDPPSERSDAYLKYTR